MAVDHAAPAYLALHSTGELQRRARVAVDGLSSCRYCPRDCGVDRRGDEAPGALCLSARRARVSSWFAHFGEEAGLRGWRGSGTIFFAFCNLRCVFCQNWDTSHGGVGAELTASELAAAMLDLQRQGCHNINLVTPEHVVPQILEALVLAVDAGLRLPLVYNTSAYDSLHTLALLDGVVDIYMPDFKYADPALAKRYLKAADYPEVAARAIAEMHRQVGPLRFDAEGIAVRGVLVRHLVMPGAEADRGELFATLAGISSDTWLNVMGQYRPVGKAAGPRYPEIRRRPSPDEVRAAADAARAAGLRRLEPTAAR